MQVLRQLLYAFIVSEMKQCGKRHHAHGRVGSRVRPLKVRRNCVKMTFPESGHFCICACILCRSRRCSKLRKVVAAQRLFHPQKLCIFSCVVSVGFRTTFCCLRFRKNRTFCLKTRLPGLLGFGLFSASLQELFAFRNNQAAVIFSHHSDMRPAHGNGQNLRHPEIGFIL